MRVAYVSRNFLKIGLVKLLKPIWPGVIYSRISPFMVEEVDQPQLKGSKDVLVKHIIAGICGTDLELLKAQVDLRVAPAALSQYSRLYLGHETYSEVLEVGSDVIELQPGDKVAVTSGKDCFTLDIDLCDACKDHKPFLCKNSSLQPDKEYVYGGGWSEKWIYHQRQLIKIPNDITPEMGVLIEPLGIGFHAILRKPPKKTDKVLIYGAGIIGMTCLVALKYLYPGVKAYVIARHDFQKQLAEKLGGIVLQDHSYEKIAEITQGHLYKGSLGNKMILGGFDLLIDCVGSGTTMNNGLRWTRSGGTIILVGLHLFKTRIDLSPVWYQEINVLGSSGSGLETYNNQEIHTHDLVIKMLQSGFIDVDDFITHKFHLDKYKEALKVATNKKKSKAVKVLFDFRL